MVPKERHARKESNDSTLGLCIGLKESHDCTGLHRRPISRDKSSPIFSLKLQIDPRVMHEHLVKVLILMRAICGTRVTCSLSAPKSIPKCISYLKEKVYIFQTFPILTLSCLMVMKSNVKRIFIDYVSFAKECQECC